MPTSSEDFKLDDWLAEVTSDDKDLTAEERGALLKLMSREKISAKVRGSVLKETDYRRKTQALADDRRAVEAERAKFEDERKTLSDWRDQVQAQLDDAWKKYETETTSRAQLEAKVRAIAEKNGLKYEDLIGGELPPAVQPGKGPAADIDVSQFVTKADLDGLGGRFNAVSVLSQAEISDLAEEYAALFQKPLREVEFQVPGPGGKGLETVRGRAGLARAALASGRPLKEFFEGHFKVGEKRREMEILAARKDEREQAEREFRAKFGEPGSQRPTFPDEQVPQNAAQRLVMGSDRPPAPGSQGVPEPAKDRVARAMAAHRERLASGIAWKE